MHRSGTPEKYKKIITEYDLPPSCIPIEITESAAIDSLELQPIAETFHNAGFHLHMDDFGSGHSSLNGLNLLHFDVVKLDKSLIDGIGDHRGDLVLTYTIALAKELGVQVIAEGVEHRKQLDFLKENECDSIQGYFYAKPLPPESFEQYVAANLDAHTQHHNRRPKYTLTPIQDALKWAMDHMIHSMPGGFFTYEATGEERILSSNRYVWELFGCESESEFMEHVHGSFKGFVAPEQLEQVERSIRSQIQNTPNQMDYVEYEIIRKDGSRLLIVDYGHLTGPSTDVFYVFISEADRLFER